MASERLRETSNHGPWLAAAALAASLHAGCAVPVEPDGAVALGERFPEQAARVLTGAGSMIATDDGFASDTPRAGLEMILPRDGSGAIRLGLASGLEARVREEGMFGEGAIAGDAATYARHNGASFWTVTPSGYEEWLHIAPGEATAGRAIAAWIVEGARLRAAGAAVELLDAEGIARVRVTAPEAFAASGRQVTARLDVRGDRIELSADAGGEEVLVDPAWTYAGLMGWPRAYHTTTLLPDGRALAVGGMFEGFTWTASETTDLFDPSTNTWSPGPSVPPNPLLGSHRPLYHTATWLPEIDAVLIAGGSSDFQGANAVAVLYDAVSSTWSPAASMGTERIFHTATRLRDGRVLVAGGHDASAELYDPVAGTWSPAASMLTSRSEHTATLLTDGRVLVAGGDDAGPVASAELYDPEANTWSPAGSLGTARQQHAATRLADGRVLVAGGWSWGAGFSALTSAEVYDPATNLWSPATSMALPRLAHTATRLHNGTVLVAGGVQGVVEQGDDGAFTGQPAFAEVYDPVTDKWAPTGTDLFVGLVGGVGASATPLQNGDVLLAGGAFVDFGYSYWPWVYATSVRYAPSAPACVTIQRGVSGAVEDTYVGSDQPNANHGSESGILIGNLGATVRQGLVRFDLAGIPAGALVMSAKVTLTGKTSAPATVRVHRVLAPWSEPALTWSGLAGGYDPVVLASFGSAGSSHVLDVSHQVQAWIDQAQPNDGLLFEQDPGEKALFSSSEALIVGARPRLDVCYVMP